MLIAATLSLAIAFLARRLGIKTDAIRTLSRDPACIFAALLAAAVIILTVRLIWLQGF